MFRSAQPGQFSTYHIQNIDIPCLAVLIKLWLSMSKSKNSPLSPSIIIDTLRTPASRPLSSAEYSWRDEAQVMNISGARQRCENGDMEVMTPHHTPAQYQPPTSAIYHLDFAIGSKRRRRSHVSKSSIFNKNLDPSKYEPDSDRIWRKSMNRCWWWLLAAGWAAGAIPWAPIFKPRQLITIIITRQHRPYNNTTPPIQHHNNNTRPPITTAQHCPYDTTTPVQHHP